jgi:beta-glucosidase
MNLGEHGLQSGSLEVELILVPGLQQELLEEVYKVNPNVVLIFKQRKTISYPWADAHVPANCWSLAIRNSKW